MRTLLVPGLLMLLSAGCATAPSKAIPACPREVEYSKEEQVTAADELDALPPQSILHVFMADYGRLRAQTRACRGAS
jgi:hypothetical protein